MQGDNEQIAIKSVTTLVKTTDKTAITPDVRLRELPSGVNRNGYEIQNIIIHLTKIVKQERI